MRLGVVLFNLGGPDTLQAVEPFLFNLFNDKAILRVPSFLRRVLAFVIARRRRRYAQEIYRSIGGGSPIARLTQDQATALEAQLSALGHSAKVVVAMRHWHPRADAAVALLKSFAPEHVVLLPLYPQFSTTTTQSSLDEWEGLARKAGLQAKTHAICCYPQEPGFVGAYAAATRAGLAQLKPGQAYRILFSAHGLPERVVKAGDPYPLQIEAGAKAILAALGGIHDFRVTYQSRVGPLKWIGPDTDAEIEAAAKAGLVPVVVPISFVSEHSETLYELDQIYRKLALDAGAPDYIRVPALGTARDFIDGLAAMTLASIQSSKRVGPGGGWAGCGAAEACPCRAK